MPVAEMTRNKPEIERFVVNLIWASFSLLASRPGALDKAFLDHVQKTHYIIDLDATYRKEC